MKHQPYGFSIPVLYGNILMGQLKHQLHGLSNITQQVIQQFITMNDDPLSHIMIQSSQQVWFPAELTNLSGFLYSGYAKLPKYEGC